MAKASLSEVYESVDTTKPSGRWKRLLSFLGPAYLVSVGYMDPGNWATDIAGGSKFGYQLLWVLLLSNLIALLLQSLSTRLGVVTRRDLAQASRETYPKYINYCLYGLAEIAIAATDLAEVIGMAIGIKLLFNIPLLLAVSITVFDTFLLLWLQKYGMRKMEAFILGLVAVIGASFLMELFFAEPQVSELIKGFKPTALSGEALFIAIGIIGATVMPHNLYLHSSLVQTRKISPDSSSIRSALRFNFIDSAVALNLAFLVNASILILSASTFFRSGMHEVTEIQDAFKFLSSVLDNKWASILFAIALIAAGQSSTITGTLSGQIVMEGYLDLRIQPWLRRLLTRMIAIIPAVIAIMVFGEGSTGTLLVLSQVILSLQLGFAIVPLIQFVSDKKRMGEFSIKPSLKILAWLSSILIIGLNIKLVVESVITWNREFNSAWWIWFIVVPIITAAFGLLIYLMIFPVLGGKREKKSVHFHLPLAELDLNKTVTYKRIAIAVDFSTADQKTIAHAVNLGGKNGMYLLIHVVESPGALLIGENIADKETFDDKKQIQHYVRTLQDGGFQAEFKIAFGSPKSQLANETTLFNADVLVLGSHGHQWYKDLLFGTTIDAVRHKLKIPVLVVR